MCKYSWDYFKPCENCGELVKDPYVIPCDRVGDPKSPDAVFRVCKETLNLVIGEHTAYNFCRSGMHCVKQSEARKAARKKADQLAFGVWQKGHTAER